MTQRDKFCNWLSENVPCDIIMFVQHFDMPTFAQARRTLFHCGFSTTNNGTKIVHNVHKEKS